MISFIKPCGQGIIPLLTVIAIRTVSECMALVNLTVA